MHPHSGALNREMLVSILSPHNKGLWASNHAFSIDILELQAAADDDNLESQLDTLALGNLEPFPGIHDVWAGTLIWPNTPTLAGRLTSLLLSMRD